jgi:glycosyltransferase involved in cell wall biosynthesis
VRTPTLAAVIPTYNHASVVVEAVESALAQTRSLDEVIVVDDGSTDDTRERLQMFGARITYIYQENRGLAAARNTGLRNSNSDWVGFLDADDLWLPEKVQRQIALIERVGDQVGCVHTRFWVVSPEFRVLSPVPPLHGSVDLAHLVRRNWVGVLTAVVRRDVAIEAGGFDEELRAVEDWDMWLRLALAGVQFAYIPTPLAIYRASESSMHWDLQRMEVSGSRMFDKLFSRPDLPTNIVRLERLSRASFMILLAWQAAVAGNRQTAFDYLGKAMNLHRPILARPLVFKVTLEALAGRRGRMVWNSLRKISRARQLQTHPSNQQ